METNVPRVITNKCNSPYLLGQIGLVGNSRLISITSAYSASASALPIRSNRISWKLDIVVALFCNHRAKTLPIRSNRISWKRHVSTTRLRRFLREPLPIRSNRISWKPFTFCLHYGGEAYSLPTRSNRISWKRNRLGVRNDRKPHLTY